MGRREGTQRLEAVPMEGGEAVVTGGSGSAALRARAAPKTRALVLKVKDN